MSETNPNSTEVKVNFFDTKPHVGSIVGTVWQDMDGNGVRDLDPETGAFTDPGLANWTVFLDANGNTLLDTGEVSTLTDSAGNYRFDDVPAKAGETTSYELTEVLPSNWEVQSGFDIAQTVEVPDGGTVTAGDFANVSSLDGAISGIIWNDLDVDGIRATDPTTGEYLEPGLENWTVFLDYDNDGSPSDGEPLAFTDAFGCYAFTGLTTGDYEVTEVLPAGWNVSPTFDVRQTVAVVGGEMSKAGDFANFSSSGGSIRGVMWNDYNNDHIRTTDPGLPGSVQPRGLVAQLVRARA